jgi:hypothetical protein
VARGVDQAHPEPLSIIDRPESRSDLQLAAVTRPGIDMAQLQGPPSPAAALGTGPSSGAPCDSASVATPLRRILRSKLIPGGRGQSNSRSILGHKLLHVQSDEMRPLPALFPRIIDVGDVG